MKVRFAAWYSWGQTIAGGLMLVTGLAGGHSQISAFVAGPLILISGLVSFTIPYLEVKDERLNIWHGPFNQKAWSLSELDTERDPNALYAWTGKRWRKIAWRMSANKKEWETFVEEYCSTRANPVNEAG